MRKKLPPEVIEYFKKQGKRGGKIGGETAARNMTPEERTARAKKAAAASAAVRSSKAKAGARKTK
jgi:hypothetical protein